MTSLNWTKLKKCPPCDSDAESVVAPTCKISVHLGRCTSTIEHIKAHRSIQLTLPNLWVATAPPVQPALSARSKQSRKTGSSARSPRGGRHLLCFPASRMSIEVDASFGEHALQKPWLSQASLSGPASNTMGRKRQGIRNTGGRRPPWKRQEYQSSAARVPGPISHSHILSMFIYIYIYIYRRLGGWVQPGNRFVSFVRAYARFVGVVETRRKMYPAIFPFPLCPWGGFPFPWAAMFPFPLRSEIEVNSKWNRLETESKSRWHRSETEPTSKWNRCEIEAKPKWNRSVSEVKSKWYRSVTVRSEIKSDTEVKSKWDQSEIEVTEVMSKWNRSES